MKAVINGRKYDTSCATLIAHDRWFNGRDYHTDFRNRYLYKTPRGRFFLHVVTQWQHERDTIRPISREDARELYERLPVHIAEYEQVFGEPEEA